MKELIKKALDTSTFKGADFVEINFLKLKEENITLKNFKSDIEKKESQGIGIRVIVNGFWGFASTNSLNLKEIDKTANFAVKIAKNSAKIKSKGIILSPLSSIQANYKTPLKINPFLVPLEEKLKLLFATQENMKKVKNIKTIESFMNFWHYDKIFANSEGTYITQEIFHSGGGIKAQAVSENEVQIRSYPSSFRGDFLSGGYEEILNFKLKENSQNTAEEANALLKAKQCPQKITDLILGGSQLSLQIHESCGHPSELDRVLGSEANYAGRSFLTLDKLGKLKYGSPIINIVADATYPGGLGTFGYDDEGVQSQKINLIKNGIFTGYLTSRETAPILNQASSGATRADGWWNIPLVRMTNINLLPGNIPLEDLIADTKEGIYMETNRSWSIDDMRINFQFGTEIAWEVKNGKKGNLIKNATYTGNTLDFWNSCNAISNKNSFRIWGTPNCGKGQPMQVMHTAQGCSPARFKNIQIGTGYKK